MFVEDDTTFYGMVNNMATKRRKPTFCALRIRLAKLDGQQARRMLEEAHRLDDAQAKENDGRGVQCVKAMVLRLFQNEYSWAQSIRRIEGDKTRAYPKLEKVLTEIFGCRLHGASDCQDWLCKKLGKGQ